MSKEEKGGEEKTKAEKELEELRKEIEKKREDIQELQKKVEELRTKVSQKKPHEAQEVGRMLKDVSEILDIGFNTFGISSKGEKTESRGLSGLIRDLAKLAEESRSFRKEVDLGGRRGVMDFSVRTGPLVRPGTRPRTSFVGARRLTVTRERAKPSVQPPVDLIEKREPLVDVFDEGDNIKVVAEFPGVEKDDIILELVEDVLTLKVDTQTKKYYKEVKLPTAVEKEVFGSTYRNGILEVKLKKMA